MAKFDPLLISSILSFTKSMRIKLALLKIRPSGKATAFVGLLGPCSTASVYNAEEGIPVNLLTPEAGEAVASKLRRHKPPSLDLTLGKNYGRRIGGTFVGAFCSRVLVLVGLEPFFAFLQSCGQSQRAGASHPYS